MQHKPSERRINSRWSRAPRLQDGAPAVAHLTERDIEIFKVLARYRYLPADYIHALVGGSLRGVVQRLSLLTRQPNLYLARPLQQRRSADANYRRLVYELDSRAIALLRELGLQYEKRQVRNFFHELLTCEVRASIEAGVRQDPSARLITWDEIKSSDRTPIETRNSSRGAYVPITYSIGGTPCVGEIRADGEPFGLERSVGGDRTYLFFPGVEVDCGTEPISSSDSQRSSIQKKLLAYLAIAEQGTYRTHFGFPNLFVPFVTQGSARLESIMTLLSDLTGGLGARMFLFKTLASNAALRGQPPQTVHMFTEPWLRVGYGPLLLAK